MAAARLPIVVARTPVRAMLAVPLVDEGRRSGALNVFADRTGVFDDEALETAAILASFASVALAGASHSAAGRPARGGAGHQPRDRRRGRDPDGHPQASPRSRPSTC